MCGKTENQYNASVPKEKLYEIQVGPMGDGFNSFYF